MQPSTQQKTEEHSKYRWRFLPTVFLMRAFRLVDKQESPTLTHTVGHVFGNLAIVVLGAAALFWRSIPAALSFLFGSSSMLWQPIQLKVWMLLLWLMVPFVFLGLIIWIQSKNKRIAELEAKVEELRPRSIDEILASCKKIEP